jgi:2-enoate reductase
MVAYLVRQQKKRGSKSIPLGLSDRVEVLTGTKLLQITDEGALIETRDGQRELKADTVVLAVGLRPQKTLMEGLEDKLDNVHAVGDCVEARNIMNAVWQGFNVARLI